MNVYELRVPGASEPGRLEAVRWELFVFPEVRDVVVAVRADVVAVLHEGDPAPAAWVRTLRAAGYVAEDPDARPAGEPRPAA